MPFDCGRKPEPPTGNPHRHWQISAVFQVWTASPNWDHVFKWDSHSSLVTHLSHPEGDFINLIDGHKCLHIVKEEHIVKDGGKQGQRAIEHCSGEDALPEGQDAPAHSSFSITLLRLFSVPSCNHLTAWRTRGHHLMVSYKNKQINPWRLGRNIQNAIFRQKGKNAPPEARLSALRLNLRISDHSWKLQHLNLIMSNIKWY